jgi:hypothetical protein
MVPASICMGGIHIHNTTTALRHPRIYELQLEFISKKQTTTGQNKEDGGKGENERMRIKLS